MTAAVTRIHPVSGTAIGDASQRFLRRDLFQPTTRKAYARTLDALAASLGATTDLTLVTAEQLEDLLAAKWGDTSPATYNRHLAALGSFFGWATDRGWITYDPTNVIEARKLRRLAEHEKRERPISVDLLNELWAKKDLNVRDKTLWRMAYETWARADELLRIDVVDLDLGNREGRVHAKGGNIETIWWATGTARLLPRVLDGRTTGPLFLADRLPIRPMPTADIDPTTGRARLGYRQAEKLFSAIGEELDASGAPWTLHRLRHSGIAHAVEAGWNLAQVRAKSRHASLRSLEVYANPSAASVRAMTDALDPEARRRT